MKKAFTLAESLIVLGIIAILATLSTIALGNVKPSNDVILFRKAYATVSKSIENLKDNGAIFAKNCDSDELSIMTNYCRLRIIIGNPTSAELQNYPWLVEEGGRFMYGFANLVGVENIDTIKNTATTVSRTGGNATFINFSTPDGIYWEVGEAQNSGEPEIYIYPDGEKSANSACGYSEDDCPRPNKFLINVNRDGELSLVIPPESKDEKGSTVDPIACTYLRYPRINKFSKFPTAYDGNTCF